MIKVVSYRPGIFSLLCLIYLLSGCGNKGTQKSETSIRLVDLPEMKKVEVWIGKQLFTSYIYPDQLKKPVLYPINTASGREISRGFPLHPREGERKDHPHHLGLWMNYGDVNGLDFWNNSSARPQEDSLRYGTIRHKEVRSTQGKEDEGMLDVVNEWLTPQGEILLREYTRFVFSAQENSRIIDRITTLEASGQEVSFADNKEGMFALRVSRSLELPTEKSEDLADAHGNYLSSEGIQGAAVWGTRARWMELYASLEEEQVALVIFDHPDNVGYPTYWHARGYGLFAANPLGQAVFSKGEQVLDFKLAPYESVSFKYRLLVHSGSELSPAFLDNMAEEFARVQTPATD
jgi:hypothetical protein